MVLHSIVFFILDFILSIFVYPFFILFTGPVFLYRWIVILFAKLFFPTYMPGALIDQSVAHDYFSKKQNPLIFSEGAMITANGTISLAHLRTNFKKNFIEKRDSSGSLLYPKLSTTLILFGGYVFFKPLQKIDIESHIHQIELHPNDLDEYKATFIANHFRKNGPLWEIILIQFKEEAKVLFRFHHTIADGYSQIHMLHLLLLVENTSQMVPSVEKEPEYGIWDMVQAAISLPRVIIIYVIELWLARNSIPLVTNSHERTLIASTCIYMSDMKQIYRKTRTSFIALNLALYTGVVRRLLEGKVHGGHTYVQIATFWPNHPSRQGKIGNHFSGGAIRVPLKEENIVNRLRDVDHNIKLHHLRSLDKIIFWYICPFLTFLPLNLTWRLLQRMQKGLGLKLIFSTLPIFHEFNYELDGCPVISLNPLLTRCSYESVLLGSAVMYNERCEFTFVATPQVAKDQSEMNRLVDKYFQEEMDAMLEQVEDTEQVV